MDNVNSIISEIISKTELELNEDIVRFWELFVGIENTCRKYDKINVSMVAALVIKRLMERPNVHFILKNNDLEDGKILTGLEGFSMIIEKWGDLEFKTPNVMDIGYFNSKIV